MLDLEIVFGITITVILCVIVYLLEDIRDELRRNNY